MLCGVVVVVVVSVSLSLYIVPSLYGHVANNAFQKLLDLYYTINELKWDEFDMFSSNFVLEFLFFALNIYP